MSLENFQIPIVLIPELYKDSLVQLEAEQATSINLKESRLTFTGSNLKNILILTEDAHHLHLADTDLEFLANILNACKLNLNDVAIVNLFHNKGADFILLSSQFKPENILLFGVIGASIGIQHHSDNYELTKWQNINIISGDHLSAIATQPELKKKLWLQLKKLFQI